MKKSLAVVLLCGLMVSLVAPRESSAVIFGTSYDGTPINWSETLNGGTAVVDSNGYLQITSAGNTNMELNYFGGLPLAQGSRTAMIVVWEDENTDGTADPGLEPRIDFTAQDGRAGHKLNRVNGGSLFSFGHYGAIRYNEVPETPTPTVEIYTGDSNANAPRAAVGTSVVHSLTIQKQADGYVDFIYDGVLLTHSDALLTTAGLGTDHSIWDYTQLRIRRSTAGEVFTIRSVQFVPEPSSLALLSLGLVGLLRRRRPSTRCSS